MVRSMTLIETSTAPLLQLQMFLSLAAKLSSTSLSVSAAKMASPVWIIILCVISSASAGVQISTPAYKLTDNPGDELVAAVNSNRTASKLSSLYSSQGLACIALQYIKAYQGDCGAVGGPNAKRPADSEFAETFAPNCGVEASTLTPITGRLLGCQSKYVKSSEAFSDILMKDDKSVEILQSKNHTEVGAAVSSSDGGAPFFWCVLFSSGKSNSSFVLEGTAAKISRPGCFSGANDKCSGGVALSTRLSLWPAAVAGLIAVAYAFGV